MLSIDYGSVAVAEQNEGVGVKEPRIQSHSYIRDDIYLDRYLQYDRTDSDGSDSWCALLRDIPLVVSVGTQ